MTIKRKIERYIIKYLNSKNFWHGSQIEIDMDKIARILSKYIKDDSKTKNLSWSSQLAILIKEERPIFLVRDMFYFKKR